MRSILNSGNHEVLTFLESKYSVLFLLFILSTLCWTKLYLIYLFVASHTSCLCRFSVGFPPTLSGCLSLSLVCLSLPYSLPGYFPTRMFYLCWEHVSLLLPLTLSSSHTGCLMAPSTMFCMKAPVSTFTVVLWSSPNGDTYIVVVIHFCICHNVSITLCIIEISLPSWYSGKLRLKSINTSHPPYCQTLSWTRCRQWSLLWTLHVEWPSYTHSNQWSLVTISIARVLWWEEKFGFSIITMSNCV